MRSLLPLPVGVAVIALLLLLYYHVIVIGPETGLILGWIAGAILGAIGCLYVFCLAFWWWVGRND